MPGIRPRRRSVRRRKNPARTRSIARVPTCAREAKPVRGVKLKTVSWLTLLFALVCLGAFLAGRPPVVGGGSAGPGRVERHRLLHHVGSAPMQAVARNMPEARRIG